MPRTKNTPMPARKPGEVVLTTTVGRQRFADLVQDAYGEKSIVGFDRYGRFLGALVPPEAIMLLAEENVDPAMQQRIRAYAKDLMEKLSQKRETEAIPSQDERRRL